MKFIADIDVMPHAGLLDPQGKTVANNMKHIDLAGIEDVRIGKHIRMVIEAHDESGAIEKVRIACDKMLVNSIMETYAFVVVPEHQEVEA
ncbi:MAG: phosphoribosylformylglycinamidine synthase subunit PurS [Bacteroidota bacterium]|jgi:phosphoribosylformylglycinamidine synthase